MLYVHYMILLTSRKTIGIHTKYNLYIIINYYIFFKHNLAINISNNVNNYVFHFSKN